MSSPGRAGAAPLAIVAALAAATLAVSCAATPPGPSAPATPPSEPSAASAEAPALPPEPVAAGVAATAAAAEAAPAVSLPSAPGAATVAVAATAASVAPAPTAAIGHAPPAPPRRSYLETALSEYSTRTFANGLVFSVKRQSGRTAAAARIALVPGAYPERLAGLPALALACAAKGSMAARPGSVDAALYAAGARLELRIDDFDDVALELVCPAESLFPLLRLVGESLVGPAFRREDFDRVLLEFKIAQRRESGDPGLRAAARLRAEAYRGHPYALPPRGSAASLAALDRDDVLRFWAEGAGAERFRVSVVGDFDPADLAREIEPLYGAIPRRSSAVPAREALPLRSLAEAESFPAYAGAAYLRAEFGAPSAGSPDYAAFSVALAMLDDLVALRLRSSDPPLAYSSWTRLSQAAAGSASLVVQGCPDPRAAKAIVEAAAAEIAKGRCLDAASGAMGAIADSLGPYLLRAVSRTYAKADGTADIAARIVRDLAAGGDGTGFFRMADRIAAVEAADVARLARERLVEGPAAWLALGDPKVVAGFAETAE